MAKIKGLFGVMNGRVSNLVMAVRNGEQIVRKYQPTVFNPSTNAQVAVRAKLKLASQLSAVLAPVIAIPRDGAKSSRNLFVKKNYGALSYSNEAAEVDMLNVKITDSIVGIPEITAMRVAGTPTSVTTALFNVDRDIDKVVYVAVGEEANGEMRLLNSTIVEEPGEGQNFATTLQVGSTGHLYVFAYGIRLNTNRARAIYGNMTLRDATTFAELVVTRSLAVGDVTLTDTRSIEVAAYTNQNVNPDNREEEQSEMRSKKK